MSKLAFEKLSDIEVLGKTPILDTDLTGLNRGGYLRHGAGDLVFLGGRPGSGKTLMAMQIAHHVSLYAPVLFFSLEMDKKQLAARLSRGKRSTAGAELYICDQPGLNAGQICEAITSMAEEESLGLVIIDYAQIVQAVGRTKAEEVGSVVRMLKETAKETGISILLLAQMSRDIEKRSQSNEFAEPVMSDYADSAEIEKFADACLMLHRVPKQEGLYKVFCVKNRHGDAVPFELKLNSSTLRFEDEGSGKIYQF